MHDTKVQLILRTGLKCMCCGEEYPLYDLQWHHIKPRYVYKACHEAPDDSYENGSLLCKRCHVAIHKYKWKDKEYQAITDTIRKNKARFEEEVEEGS